MTGVFKKGPLVYLPDDLREALSDAPHLKAKFDSLSEHIQYLHVKHVVETSDPKERTSRIQNVLEVLSQSENK